MVRRRTSSHAADAAEPDAADRTETLEVPVQAPDGTPTGSDDQARPPTMRRAEEMADRLGARISHYAGIVGHKLLVWGARAREEMEDIWAEAQDVRRRWQAGPAPQGQEPPAR